MMAGALLPLFTYADISTKNMNNNQEQIVLGGGCFWCVEAVFKSLRGVSSVVSGYSGGRIANPTYDQVSHGNTGHVEVVRITFDPSAISLKQILVVFFHAHDPTTLNRQGHDRGPEYRSVVFYSSEEQRTISQQVKSEIEEEKVWESPIVTAIEPLDEFYPAEDLHQDYFKRNKEKPYCSIVIAPKLQKVWRTFPDLIVPTP